MVKWMDTDLGTSTTKEFFRSLTKTPQERAKLNNYDSNRGRAIEWQYSQAFQRI